MKKASKVIGLVGVLGLLLPAGLSAQRLVWIGSMGTPYAEARGVSEDGSTVVGWAGVYSPHKAFRWTESTGTEDLGSFSKRDAEAWGISGDGSTAVGYSFVGTSGSIYRAIVWRANQMLDLGTLGGDTSWARDANFDGTVIVGAAQLPDGFNRAFRWTPVGGMENLGVLPGAIRSVAWAVTPDGETVVGWSGFGNQIHHAIRWTRETGMVDLHDPNNFNWSEAEAVSADGTTVVGAAENRNGHQHAFRWTAETGMVDLGVLPGSGTWSEAWAASADGRIVAGWSEVASGQWHAFRWTPEDGMQDLNVLYAEAIPEGSVLQTVYAMSADGRFYVGTGYNAQTGLLEAYLLDTQPLSVVLPSSFTVTRGVQTSGALQDLFFSDDSYLNVQARRPTEVAAASVEIEVEGTATSSNPSELKFTLEAASSGSPARQRIEVFNFANGTWEMLDERDAPAADTSLTFTLAGDLSRFVEAGTRRMRVRIGYHDRGVTFLDWGGRFDVVNWQMR
ncbi:MAG: hypothetical protein KatS3mg015_1273 [Fimbriimonadales bacterium]|nr:MAG: hypothetical protein KatS3mg015_1273 [Fimbriimonadales bacterium]